MEELKGKKLLTICYYDDKFKKQKYTDWFEDVKQAKHHFYVNMEAKKNKFSLIKIIPAVESKI